MWKWLGLLALFAAAVKLDRRARQKMQDLKRPHPPLTRPEPEDGYGNPET